MHITILGSGTCKISLKRGCSGAYIYAENRHCLVDLGPGTLYRLLKAGHSVHEIDIAVITHFHPDHVSDLIPFMFTRKHTYQGKRKQLTLIGGHGFKQFIKELNTLFQGWIMPHNFVEILELADSSLIIDGLTIKTCTVMHNRESIAVRIEESNGRSLVISGDTDYCDRLVNLSKGSDLLLLESSCLDDIDKVSGHMTPSIAEVIGCRSSAKRLILTHLNPDLSEDVIFSRWKGDFKGDVLCAKDLETYYID